ncbi:MAG: acyltransferase family protein [Geminicoccaceae bacterium]
MADRRVDWADCAKGLTIILVVYGHAVVGVGKDVAIDPTLYAYVMKPFSQFRMPVFFFITGMFAALSLRRDWPTFLDRTLFHLLYVFVVWNVLQFAARFAFQDFANDPIDGWRILLFPVRPINITWFVWALLWYYGLARVFRDVPVVFLVAVAALLSTVPTVHDDWYAYRQTARFSVYFMLGVGASAWMLGRPTTGRLPLAAGLVAAYVLVAGGLIHLGLDEQPIADLAASLLGIAAIVSVCMALAEHGRGAWLRRIGAWSLPIFVIHTLVTAAAREALLRLGLSDHAVVLVAVATVAGVAGPIALAWTLERLGFPWLFERPAWLRRASPPAAGPLRA